MSKVKSNRQSVADARVGSSGGMLTKYAPVLQAGPATDDGCLSHGTRVMGEPVRSDNAARDEEECQAQTKPGPGPLLRKVGQLDDERDLGHKVHDDSKPQHQLVEYGHLL